MKIRKLLALALTGATLLSTVPVNAQKSNSIGYTSFMPLDDGGTTYLMNSEHVKIGTAPTPDFDLETLVYNKIPDQEIKLPKNMWVSFDVINTTFDETQERYEWDDTDDFRNYISSNNFEVYSKDELETNELPTDCLVTFKQDGKIIKQFNLDVDKRLDHESFKFYNKSDSPVIVSTQTDKWFIGDVGYTAHKSDKDLTDADWSFSFKKKESFIATTGLGCGAGVGIATPDGKPVTAIITQGKFVKKKTIKSGSSVTVFFPKKGKYKITINSNSEFFNIRTEGYDGKYVHRKSNLIIPENCHFKESRGFSPFSSLTNRYDFLVSSSGKGNFLRSPWYGQSTQYYNLQNFNETFTVHDSANSFYTNYKLRGWQEYPEKPRKFNSKGNGWLYAAQRKGSKLVYDRLSW